MPDKSKATRYCTVHRRIVQIVEFDDHPVARGPGGAARAHPLCLFSRTACEQKDCRYHHVAVLGGVLGQVMFGISEEEIKSQGRDYTTSALSGFMAVSARPHHCHFVHEVLRKLGLERPMEAIALLADSVQLVNLWQQAGEGFEEQVAPIGLTSIVGKLGEEHRAAFVTLPTPLAPSESYFACVVMPKRNIALSSFFTLALESQSAGEHRAVLLEWTRGELQHNMGISVEPTRKTFLYAVHQRLISNP